MIHCLANENYLLKTQTNCYREKAKQILLGKDKQLGCKFNNLQ